MMTPINVDAIRLQLLACTFGCATGSFPFSYLGLPLSLSRPSVEDFQPIVSRCEKRLVSTSIYLSQAGRLQLTNAVFTALPMFTMCTLLLHKTVVRQIDKYRKHCLWRGGDISDRRPSKAAWNWVCLPKDEGGLGVLRLDTQNEVLLMKFLHKFFNKANIPWVHLIWEKYFPNGKLPGYTTKGSFWWKDVLKSLNSFKGIAVANVFEGSTCALWDDLWAGKVPRLAFPELYSFAKVRNISLQRMANFDDLTRLFHLPLSEPAFEQLVQLAQDIQNSVFSEEHDVWTYIWGSRHFSSSRIYSHLIGKRVVHPAFKWIWKTFCQKMHIVFFWLLLRDRLSTRNLLKRRNMELPEYNCVLCASLHEETQEHLFLDCHFAQACWHLLGLLIPAVEPLQVIQELRVQLDVPFAMEVIILMSWCIWMARNDLIFRGILPIVARVKDRFKDEFALVILRAKPQLRPEMSSWLHARL